MDCTELEIIVNKFNTLTEKPVKFLTVQSEIQDDIKDLVKNIYSFTKEQEKDKKKNKHGALPELIVEGFDDEQIWQQIELQNTDCWDHLVWEVANCISVKANLVFPVNISNDLEEDKDDTADEGSSDEAQLTSEVRPKNGVTTAMGNQIVNKNTKLKSFIVDDNFFKLQEMETFLLSEEKKDGKLQKVNDDSDEESINMFEDDQENDKNNDDMMYSDFFAANQVFENEGISDNNENDGHMSYDEIEEEVGEIIDKHKSGKKVRFAQALLSDDEDSIAGSKNNTITTNTDEKKSEFELRQLRLKQQIERLEEKTLKEAPWQLKGEVNSSKRPQNSLLQEVVDFDLTSRPAPIITEQTTVTLEDIIKRRIKDKAWDDVVKKEKPVDDQLSFRKKDILDHSKSKHSLAQVYEAEYLKQKQTLSGDIEEGQEPDTHKEIRTAMSQLFSKLDALCHYHYTPKAAQAEVKIVTNTPAISMEEVAPVATSDAALLAPEEIKKKRRGDLMSKEERTNTDKNRERRKKKKFQRIKGNVEKVTDHRNTKKGQEISNDKSLKTSKAFFQQLNDNSNSLIKTNKSKHNGKNKAQ